MIGQPTIRSKCRFAAKIAFCLFVTGMSLGLAGCSKDETLDHGANQSLVEIGERSLEEGEAFEGRGRTRDANMAYRRALWAFRYHERLTGEQPFLLDEALDGAKRTAGSGR